jgi:hypothetical protein
LRTEVSFTSELFDPTAGDPPLVPQSRRERPGDDEWDLRRRA